MYAFYPGKSPTEKPSILVSGASNGKVYILRPKSWSAYIWHYTTEVILERKNTIGVPAVRDVDGDGNVDIFIPEANYIHVLTFKGMNGKYDLYSTNLISPVNKPLFFSQMLTLSGLNAILSIL